MSKGTVLSLFDLTGNMVAPWAEAGYECICVDLQHNAGPSTEGNVTKVRADVLDYLPPNKQYAAVFAFPPCTDVAVSGARWFKEKGLNSLVHALALVDRARRLCEWSGAPWMLENPVSTISSYWRKPDYTFDPHQYGGYYDPPIDEYTKKTCLWTGGGFIMPPTKEVPAILGSKMHLLPPSEERANLRSATPMGFARAVYLANAT